MNKVEILSLFGFLLMFTLNVVFCGRNALFSLSDDNDNDHIHDDFNVYDNKDSLFDAGKILKRDKRFLLWTGGGISKIVLGFLAPVETRDNVNWRTLNLAYNYQAQYVPIPNATFIWKKIAGDFRKQRRLFDREEVFNKDLTRELIYGALELFLHSRGKPGRECLLKSICDAGEHPIVRGGVFEEIIHLILTPSIDEDINSDYKTARLAGENGADCSKLYGCKYGDGLLDKFSYLT